MEHILYPHTENNTWHSKKYAFIESWGKHLINIQNFVLAWVVFKCLALMKCCSKAST